MYGKLFSSMYDGTLADNWKALVTFQQMIVLADDVGVIDMTPRALSSRTGIPVDIIEEGLAILEQPDPYSRTPDNDGARLERLDNHRPWGWRIVNYLKYRQLASHEEKKAADRERIAAKREASRNLSQGVAECRKVSQGVADVAYTDTDRDTDKEKNPPLPPLEGGKSRNRFEPPTLAQVRDYCRERGKGVDPQKWHDHYSAKGWMIGKTKMKDWKAAVRTWEGSAKPNGADEYGRGAI